MKQPSLFYSPFIFMSFAILGFILATGTATMADFNENGGEVVIEAEDFHSITRNSARNSFYIFPGEGRTPDPDTPHTSNASNGSYVEILPDTRVNHDDPLIEGVSFYKTPQNAPRMNYRVHINNGGRYYIRARGFSTGAEDNSIHFGADGNWPNSGSPAQWCKRNQWNWTGNRRTATEHCGVYNALYLDLTRGDRTIMVAMREDGVELDKFILTMDKNYFPSGTGPSQSSETMGGNNNAPIVDAGPDQTIIINETANIDGSASDDGIPNSTLVINWEMISGPGIADIANTSNLSTTVSFNQTGSYVLQLSANDGELNNADRIGINVIEDQAVDADDPEDNDSDESNSDNPGVAATSGGGGNGCFIGILANELARMKK